MTDVTPQEILIWFKERVVEALRLPSDSVLIAAADTAPDVIPPGAVFAIVSPRDMRFRVPEQNRYQCTVEFIVRVRLYVRLAAEKPGTMTMLLTDADGSLYSMCARVIERVIDGEPPEGNFRGCLAATTSGPVEWLSPVEGNVSYVSIAMDFQADFDWALM